MKKTVAALAMTLTMVGTAFAYGDCPLQSRSFDCSTTTEQRYLNTGSRLSNGQTDQASGLTLKENTEAGTLVILERPIAAPASPNMIKTRGYVVPNGQSTSITLAW